MISIRVCVQAAMLCWLATSLETMSDFVLPDGYDEMISAEKQEELWNIILSAQNTTGARMGTMDYVNFLVRDKLSLSFTAQSDVLPHDHMKRIHTIGGIAKATYRSVGNHTYSGMFQGESDAIIRFSHARGVQSADNGTIPGIGLKLLRDGMISADLVAMFALNGQDGGNFFENRFFTHILADQTCSDTVTYIVGKRFDCGVTPATVVGLNHFALHDQEGVAVDSSDVEFPFKLIFEPNSELSNRFYGADKYADLKPMLTSIESGIKVYDVIALSGPEAEEVKIAEIHLDSQIIYSQAGDEFIFFRHEDPNTDLQYHPEWTDAFRSTSKVTVSPCPALNLF